MQTASAKLSWSHICELLSLDDIIEIKYYINISVSRNLSVRELWERIKSEEYERIGYKEELEESKINTLIKNPIMIKTDMEVEEVNEYMLHQLIIENTDDFLQKLGIMFAYIENEVKIKIGDRDNYIDFLLFNIQKNYLTIKRSELLYAGKKMGLLWAYCSDDRIFKGDL